MAKTRSRLGSTYFLHTPTAYLRQKVEEAVEKLESDGWKVYWPDRDNNLTSKEGDGFECNLENKRQMEACDFIHIFWEGKSSAFLFGLGMAFAMEKPVRIIQNPEPTTWRSFQNMITRWRSAKF